MPARSIVLEENVVSKQIIICADDFAQNEDISEGILSLAEMRRINAIGCLVNTSSWDDFHTDLIAIRSNSFIGLHLNFTFGQPLSSAWRKREGEEFYTLLKLLKKLYFRQISFDTIADEIKAQIDVFSHKMHIYPDFIDGHQHVQQLPLIRTALFDVHTRKMGHLHSTLVTDSNIDYSETFFRSTSNGFGDLISIISFPKSQALSILGGHKFKKLLIEEQIPTNASFSGIYNFKNAKNYQKYFQKFLGQTKNGGIIMCHPGIISNDLTDPLYKFRHHELNYFKSDEFLSDIADGDYALSLVNRY